MKTTLPRVLALSAALSSSCSGGAPRPAPTPNPALPRTDTPADDGRGSLPVPPDADAPAAAGTRTRTLDAETKITSASGASFTASAGWTVEERDDRIVLLTPEKDLSVALVEVKAKDRAAAVAAAWARWRRDFALPVMQEADVPARDGWDALGQVVYAAPVAERRFAAALARKKGETWYVTLVDGSQAAAERRGAQLGTVIESFTVPGLERESFAGKTPHALDAARLAQLETFIETARARAKIPGAAVAIVQGGKVVYAKGFGVRAAGKKAAVTPKTLFMIGSVNKSLTTLMLARLVERGTFTWDTPVTKVLPSFALGDPKTTEQATMRHTSCACTGMPRQDLEFIFEGDVSAEERLASMKDMRPTTGFGETFQYSNLMVSAGGFAGAHAYAPKKPLGPAYDAAMQALVLKPLGMTSSTFDFKRVARGEHAQPHPYDLDGEPKAMPASVETWVEPLRPAGGMWSNVNDMARFALLELGRGKLGGKQVVSEEALLARRAPQVKINDELAYGLGLVVGKRDGLEVVTHSGGTMGFTTEFMLLPEHGIGLVILSNVGSGGVFTGTVERRLLELLFDAEPRAEADLERRVTETDKELGETLKRIQTPPDAAWLAPLLGTWRAPGLGRIELRMEGKKAVLDTGGWKVEVGKKTEVGGDVKLVAVTGPFAGLELVPTDVDGLKHLVLADGQHSYVFAREAK